MKLHALPQFTTKAIGVYNPRRKPYEPKRNRLTGYPTHTSRPPEYCQKKLICAEQRGYKYLPNLEYPVRRHLAPEYLEQSIAHELALLLMDYIHDRRLRWRITGTQVTAIEEEIGERLTVIVLRKAGFKPSSDSSDDWYLTPANVTGVRTVPLPHPEDFRIHFDKLDVGGQLKAALGLDR